MSLSTFVYNLSSLDFPEGSALTFISKILGCLCSHSLKNCLIWFQPAKERFFPSFVSFFDRLDEII